MIKVILIDKDQVTEHVRGEINSEKFYGCSLLERNRRLYKFEMWQDGVAYYFEINDLPYVIWKRVVSNAYS